MLTFKEWQATRKFIPLYDNEDGCDPGPALCYGPGENVIEIDNTNSLYHLHWMGTLYENSNLEIVERQLYECASKDGCL